MNQTFHSFSHFMDDTKGGWRNPKADFLTTLDLEQKARERRGLKHESIEIPTGYYRCKKDNRLYFHESDFDCPSLQCEESCKKNREGIQRQLQSSRAENVEMQNRAEAAEAQVIEYKERLLWYASALARDREELSEVVLENRKLESKLEDRKNRYAELKRSNALNVIRVHTLEKAWRGWRRNIAYWKETGCLHPDSKGFKEAIAESWFRDPVRGKHRVQSTVKQEPE